MRLDFLTKAVADTTKVEAEVDPWKEFEGPDDGADNVETEEFVAR